MRLAAERTKVIVVKAVTDRASKQITEQKQQYESDGSGHDSPPCGVNQGNEFADEVKSMCADEVKSVSRFIDALPSCLLMDLGFHIQSKTSGESKFRICVQHDICVTFLILTTYDTFHSTILTVDIDKTVHAPNRIKMERQLWNQD
jgi:hypothetical protein